MIQAARPGPAESCAGQAVISVSLLDGCRERMA